MQVLPRIQVLMLSRFETVFKIFKMEAQSEYFLNTLSGAVVTAYFQMYLARLQKGLNAGTLQVLNDHACQGVAHRHQTSRFK